MASFGEYVDSLSPSLKDLNESSSLFLTIGNETSDLDSVVCALSHAHYLSSRESGAISLPVLQCARSEFTLRQDAQWLCGRLNLDPEKFVYLEDVTSVVGRVGSVRVTLVDHAQLPAALAGETKVKVEEIIDHHMEGGGGGGGGGKGEGGSYREVREGVGSCSTLVAEKLLSDDKYTVEAIIATLLAAAILIDTVDLVRESGRVTDKDIAMADQLLPLSLIPRSQLYSSLLSGRLSVEKLSSSQLLGKDYKVTVAGSYRIGFSSITCLLADFLTREGIVSDLETFCKSRNLSVLLLLGISISGEATTREVVVYRPPSSSASSDFADSIASVLEADEDLRCQRKVISDFPGHLLTQGNHAKSRKYILPFVVQFVTSIEQEADSTESASAAVAVLSVQEPVTGASGDGEGVSGQGEGGVKKKKASLIPEYTQQEENEDVRSHLHVSVGGEEMDIDILTIEPYKKIIQHAGYVGTERKAVLVISACYLPPHSIPNYHDVMHQLFFYVLSVVERLVVDDYIIVYLHSGAPHHSMPSLGMFHKFYKMIDRRLRKQLMHLYLVHPTFWVKTMLRLARPFISGKFYRKVHFVRCLQQLPEDLTLEPQLIPAPVQRADSVLQPRPQPQDRYKPIQE